jgi:uncharacterized protein
MPAMTQAITVIKRNPEKEEVMRYSGKVLKRASTSIVLEALFNRPDMPFMGTILREGDRFVETYFTDRWYNIFEIHDREDDRIKGWYCNIGFPAILEAEDRISYVDLALDLWVAPDGKQTVLDEDEFASLSLDTKTRHRALVAMKELQALFSEWKAPDFE